MNKLYDEFLESIDDDNDDQNDGVDGDDTTLKYSDDTLGDSDVSNQPNNSSNYFSFNFIRMEVRQVGPKI